MLQYSLRINVKIKRRIDYFGKKSTADKNFGGGGGTGVTVSPVGFLVIEPNGKVDLLNLTPVFYNGVTPVIKTAVDSVGQTVEYAVIAICLPKVHLLFFRTLSHSFEMPH